MASILLNHPERKILNFNVPRTVHLVPSEVAGCFRECWSLGMLIEFSWMKASDLFSPFYFLEMNTRGNFWSKKMADGHEWGREKEEKPGEAGVVHVRRLTALPVGPRRMGEIIAKQWI